MADYTQADINSTFGSLANSGWSMDQLAALAQERGVSQNMFGTAASNYGSQGAQTYSNGMGGVGGDNPMPDSYYAGLSGLDANTNSAVSAAQDRLRQLNVLNGYDPNQGLNRFNTSGDGLAATTSFLNGFGGNLSQTNDYGYGGIRGNVGGLGSVESALTQGAANGASAQQQGGGMTYGGGPTLRGYQRSPYLDEMFKTIDAQANQQWDQQIAPSIKYGQQAAGGFGDSRQGIAEGIAAGNLQTNVAAQKAQAGQADYNTNTGQNLQQYGLELQNQLGLGNLSLGFQNSNNSYDLGVTNATNSLYNTNRQLDLQALGLGSSLYSAGNAGYLGQGQGIQGIGDTQQQAAWTPVNNLSNLYSQYSGLGGQTVGTQTGSTLGNAAGGAIAGSQLGKLWSGGSTNTNIYSNPSNTGFGTGSQWGNQDYGQYF